MPTEQERIGKLEDDMIDMKVRMGVAEGDIKAIKGKLDKIDHNVSKIIWGVFGTFGTVFVTLITLLGNYLINHYGGK